MQNLPTFFDIAVCMIKYASAKQPSAVRLEFKLYDHFLEIVDMRTAKVVQERWSLSFLIGTERFRYKF